jgi:hypothetical protein
MFDVELPHDPRVDAGVVLDRIVRRFPDRYAIALDVLRQTRLERAIHGTVLVARIARNALVGLTVRVKHDEERARTRLVMRPVIPSRRLFVVLAPLLVVLYPIAFVLAFAIRRDVLDAMKIAPMPAAPYRAPSSPEIERTIVAPPFATRGADVFAATVPYVPLRAQRAQRMHR